MLLSLAVFAQRTITGKVTDEKGNPVANVSIVVKGTTTGTSTKADGSYTLALPANAKALIFSSVDMGEKELTIGSSSVISTIMSTQTKGLDEVVVTAYGTIKREALTGSIGTIKAAEIEKRPVGNVIKVLEGSIPGLITTSGSGQPGSGTALRVRGFGSINATSEPLIVLDGVPYVGGTSNINPDDVENISVLKDATSTALYGSRGANGVVIITTKKGKKGRNNISVRLMQGVASLGLQGYERVNSFQYYPLMWEAYRNSLVYPASGVGISLDSANRVATGLTTRTSIRGLLAYNPFNVPVNTIVGTDGKINPSAQLLYADDLDWEKRNIEKWEQKRLWNKF